MTVKPLLIRAGTTLVRYLPPFAARGIAVLAADVCWLALSRRRQIIRQNLENLGVDRSSSERRRLTRETFRNLARCSLHFLQLPLLSAHQVLDLIEWRGLDHLDAAIARGRGVVLITGHCGNWELAAVAVAARGDAFYVYAEDTGIAPPTFAIYEKYRSGTGGRIIPVSRGPFAGCRALRNGAVVMLIADRAIGGEGFPVTFGQGRRPVPRGPSVMLRRTCATPLLISLTLQQGARPYAGVITPIDIDQHASDAQVTQLIAGRLSETATGHPDQWFVFDAAWLPRGINQKPM